MKIRLEDGTGLDLKYLVRDTDRHGNERIYVRQHGRKVHGGGLLRSAPAGEEPVLRRLHARTGAARGRCRAAGGGGGANIIGEMPTARSTAWRPPTGINIG